MKKRTIAMLLLSALVLSACGSKKEVKEKEKEKIDGSLFEENDSKRRKYKGYTVEEVYINGKKVKIDVQSYSDYYHIIYNGKKYSLDKEKYEELFKKDNKIVLESENMEKSLKDISPDEIISYYKHGDHSHTYAGTQSVNPTKVKFKFDNSEIIGFDETGYFINHKVATLSDGSEYFNIYHIDGFPKGAFELPNSMSEKLKVSEEIVSKLVKHRISEVENLIKSKENQTELLKKSKKWKIQMKNSKK